METKELNQRYEEYKARIEARIASGEKITVQDKKKWQRVVEIPDTDKPGQMKKVTLPGITGETPNERGSRVAETRMSKLLDAADRLEQATGASYKYTPDQVDKIVSAINDMSTKLVKAFEAKKVEPVEVEKAPEKKKFQF